VQGGLAHIKSGIYGTRSTSKLKISHTWSILSKLWKSVVYVLKPYVSATVLNERDPANSSNTLSNDAYFDPGSHSCFMWCGSTVLPNKDWIVKLPFNLDFLFLCFLA